MSIYDVERGKAKYFLVLFIHIALNNVVNVSKHLIEQGLRIVLLNLEVFGLISLQKFPARFLVFLNHFPNMLNLLTISVW